MRPSELVCRKLGGELLVHVSENPKVRRDWSAGIWSCHGGVRFRVLCARGSTKEAAQQALDEKLREVARVVLLLGEDT